MRVFYANDDEKIIGRMSNIVKVLKIEMRGMAALVVRIWVWLKFLIVAGDLKMENSLSSGGIKLFAKIVFCVDPCL